MSNFSSSTLSTLAIDSTGAVTVPANADLSLGTQLQLYDMAVDPAGDALFVTEQYSGIHPIALTASGDSITLTAEPVVKPGTTGCSYIALDPVGSLFFTSDSGSVSAFTYTGTGAVLESDQAASSSTGFLEYGGGPGGLCVNSTATNAFVTDPAGLYIWQLPISSAGKLSAPNDSVSSSAANGPNTCVINPAGTYLVAGNTDGTIEAFPLSSGKLTSSSSKVATASNAANADVTGLAFDPTGAYLVTANGGSNDVTLFSFSSKGAATVLSTITVAGSGPGNVCFNPNGTVVYVANTGSFPQATLSAFQITGSKLVALAGSPYALPATAHGPTGLAIR